MINNTAKVRKSSPTDIIDNSANKITQRINLMTNSKKDSLQETKHHHGLQDNVDDSYFLFGWFGVIGSLITFLVSYKLWIHFGNHKDMKLGLAPHLTFGNKKWWIK